MPGQPGVPRSALRAGPLVGLLWLSTATESHLAIRIAAFWHWTTLPTGLGSGTHLVAIAVTASAAALGIAVTGRLSRWLPARPCRAPLAAAIAGFGAVGANGAWPRAPRS